MSGVRPGRRRASLGLVTLVALAVALGAGSTRPAAAASTITVKTTSDETITDGQCSLREAINNANANADTTGGDCAAGSPGADTIDMSSLSGTILLSIPNEFGRSTLPTISDDLTVIGPSASKLTIEQAGLGRVMTVGGGASAAVSGITMTGGQGQGGGIFVAGTLTLSDSNVSGNGNAGGSGGGIFVNGIGTLTLVNSTVSDNNAAGSVGGGIANESGTLTVKNSSISGNTASQGGGIFSVGVMSVSNSTVSDNSAFDPYSADGGGIVNGAGPATVTNSTISGNTAGGALADGGGIIDFGSLTATNDTITGNGASGSISGFGGGVVLSGSTTILANTIVAGQTAGGDCSGVPFDGGYNLDGDGSCGFSAANNSLSNTDPLLDPAGLKDNGGPTQTIALQPGSPAIDAIPPTVNGCGTTITTDQRGVSRPQGSGCDIGAFEVVPPSGADLSITKSGAPNPVVSGNRLTYTITVTNNGPQDATGVTMTDALPGSLHFNSVSSSQGTCTRSTATNPQPKGGTVTCRVDNLANGAKASITIVVTATTPGTVTNTAKVSGDESDPDSSNNSATATTTVLGT